jgi:uncharacterized protein
MTVRLSFDRDALTALCRRHRISRLSLYGSVLKGTARPDSDVDLLVEFERGAAPSLFDLADIEQELSALLGGRRVDVRTAEDLSRTFREEVIREAEVQYESHEESPSLATLMKDARGMVDSGVPRTSLAIPSTSRDWGAIRGGGVEQ